MKTGQLSAKQTYSRVGAKRYAGLVLAVAAGLCVASAPVRAALGPDVGFVEAPALDLWTVAQATAPPSDAVVPPVRRETPQAPPALPAQPAAPAVTAPAATPAAPPETMPQKQPEPSPQQAAKSPPPPPEFSGFFSSIQEWLARANREYQGVVVKELSLPSGNPQAEDQIAKKLKDQEAEAAATIAEKKREEDAVAKAAAKSQDAKKLDDDRRKAEETKRLADEAKKKADEIFKSEGEKKVEPKKPEVATPAAPATPKPDDAARLEAEKKQAEDAKRQEQAKQEQLKQEQARKAEERKQAEAGAQAEADRRRAAEAAAAAQNKHQTRTVVIVPERLPPPVVRPADPGSVFRPELAPSRTARTGNSRTADSDADLSVGSSERHRRIKMRSYSEATYRGINVAAYRGTAVKRWVWRSGGRSCTSAGRRITPPARYTVARGDSLWRISERHYNEGRLYPKIYRANRSRIADPNLIYPCQRVLVPR